MKMFPHQLRKKLEAFTLLEVVIVLAILGIMLPIIFSVLFTVAKQQNKIYRLTEAKQQGDYALAFMKNYVQNNADKVFQDNGLQVEACTDTTLDAEHTSVGGSTIYFSKKDSLTEYFNFQQREYEFDSSTNQHYNQIVFDNSGDIQHLTTGTVSVENFYIKCLRKSISSRPFIFISFLVYYKTNLSTAAPEDQAILQYKGVVKMR